MASFKVFTDWKSLSQRAIQRNDTESEERQELMKQSRISIKKEEGLIEQRQRDSAQVLKLVEEARCPMTRLEEETKLSRTIDESSNKMSNS